MFTKNYINWRKAMFISSSSSYNAFLKDAVGVQFTANPSLDHYTDMGSIMALPRGSVSASSLEAFANASQQATVQKSIGLYFGSGNTPPTEDDYTLESMIMSGLSTVSGATMVDENGDQYRISATNTLKNTLSSEIVIREIGAFGEAVRYYSGKYNYHLVLFERTVLDEPLVIGPGESKVLTYSITFNQTGA